MNLPDERTILLTLTTAIAGGLLLTMLARHLKVPAIVLLLQFPIKVFRDQTLPVNRFSGGNQQKVVLAKIVTVDPEIIVFMSRLGGSMSAQRPRSIDGSARWRRKAVRVW
jgi:ABC-type uncharacterized transport system ATPase subunit